MIKLSHNLGWLHNFRTFPCPHGLDFERFFSLIKNMQPDFPITIEISPRHISGAEKIKKSLANKAPAKLLCQRADKLKAIARFQTG